MKINSYKALFLLASLCYGETQADVTQSYDGQNDPTITIHSTIQKDDVRRVVYLLDHARDKNDRARPQVYLNSIGGDVNAALQIGDLIYNKSYVDSSGVKLAVSVTAKTCASACVLILASAKIRELATDGRIIIHRPYSSDIQTHYDTYKTSIKEIKKKALTQFERVGVSERLWESMMSVKAEDAKELSTQEIQEFNLTGIEPAYADYLDNVRARTLGISKQELLKRSAEFKRCMWAAMNKQPYYIPEEHKYGPWPVVCGRATGWMDNAEAEKITTQIYERMNSR